MAPDDAHEHRVAFALREALPTRRHTKMLFDTAAEAMGPGARIESSPDGSTASSTASAPTTGAASSPGPS